MKFKIDRYLFSIITFTVVMPILLTLLEFYFMRASFSFAILGGWFLFSAVGLRLFIAGLLQLFRPNYTLKNIFNIQDQACAIIVRELGMHNIMIGVFALLTPLFPNYRFTTAVMGGLYFGAAGLLHAMSDHKSERQYIAMVSDFGISAITLLCLFNY